MIGSLRISADVGVKRPCRSAKRAGVAVLRHMVSIEPQLGASLAGTLRAMFGAEAALTRSHICMRVDGKRAA